MNALSALQDVARSRCVSPLVWCAFLLVGLSESHGQESSGVADRLVFYDSQYSDEYAGDVDIPVRYFTAHGFKLVDTEALLAWFAARLSADTCSGTVVLQVSDVTPITLVEPWDRTSALYRYCERGGRYVAPGGNTLYVFEGEQDFTLTRQGQSTPAEQRFLTSAFGIRRVYGLRGKGKKLMPSAGDWGLGDGTWMKYLQTGVPPEDVTESLVQSTDDAASLAWVKTVNPSFPHSGLVGMCISYLKHEPLLEALYKVCMFRDVPVQSVPRVSWDEPDATPPLDVQLTIQFGGIDRRAFQRGEEIPVQLRVAGAAYVGQAVELALNDRQDTPWRRTYPTSGDSSLTATEMIETARLRCGEYTLACEVGGDVLVRETIWICADRRNNPFPWFLCKMHRRNLHREELALRYVRDCGLNVNLFDLYQLEHAADTPKQALRLGRYLDLMLRLNLMSSARPTAMRIYTESQDEALVLHNGEVMKHGLRNAIGWRALCAGGLDRYRASLARQVHLLKSTGSPVLRPCFFTNDDGSMPGYFDFSEATLADFEARTGVSRSALPKMQSNGKNYFMPDVPAGVVPDDHPWLVYFRYHAGNYARLCRTAVEAIQSAWPEALVADTGCMSGPLYVSRGFYPPISVEPLNTAGFYQYDFWFHSYSFSAEAARMGNRRKPLVPTLSASWIAWGAEFQRGMIYRILAEAPASIGFWSLDARRREQWDVEEESYAEMRRIGQRLGPVSNLLTRSRIRPRQGALFMGLAQLAFNAQDTHFRNHYMRAALENFRRAGAELDLLATEELLEGRAGAYRVIFVNNHSWITPGALTVLEAYIRGGGTVVLDAATTIDIEGAVRAQGVFGAVGRESHGLRNAGDPEAIARCRRYVDRFLQPDLVTAGSADTLVRVNQADETPVVWVLDVLSHEELKGSLAARGADWGSGVRKHLSERGAAEPVIAKQVRVRAGWWAYDLWQQSAVPLGPADGGWRTGLVRTGFCGGVPLALYRDRIGSLKLSVDAPQARCGDTIQFVCGLRSAQNEPVRGLVPVEVRVWYPDGTEAWEYGSNGLIADGALRGRVDTAVNDPPGTWRLRTRELCSQLVSDTSFTLLESAANQAKAKP